MKVISNFMIYKRIAKKQTFRIFISRGPNFLALLKLIGICYFYGISSFIEDIEAMLEYSSKPKPNEKPKSNNGLKIWWKLSWGYLGPIFYSAVIVFKTSKMIQVWLDHREGR